VGATAVPEKAGERDTKKRRGKGGSMKRRKPKAVSAGFPLPWKSRRRREIPLFHRAGDDVVVLKKRKARHRPNPNPRRRPDGESLCFTKRTDRELIEPDNLTCNDSEGDPATPRGVRNPVPRRRGGLVRDLSRESDGNPDSGNNRRRRARDNSVRECWTGFIRRQVSHLFEPVSLSSPKTRGRSGRRPEWAAGDGIGYIL